MIDRNDRKYKDGDVIDIHQTVNGCRHFLIETLEPLEIFYYQDFKLGRKYEYDQIELLTNSVPYDTQTETEIISKKIGDWVIVNGRAYNIISAPEVFLSNEYATKEQVSFEENLYRL